MRPVAPGGTRRAPLIRRPSRRRREEPSRPDGRAARRLGEEGGCRRQPPEAAGAEKGDRYLAKPQPLRKAGQLVFSYPGRPFSSSEPVRGRGVPTGSREPTDNHAKGSDREAGGGPPLGRPKGRLPLSSPCSLKRRRSPPPVAACRSPSNQGSERRSGDAAPSGAHAERTRGVWRDKKTPPSVPYRRRIHVGHTALLGRASSPGQKRLWCRAAGAPL